MPDGFQCIHKNDALSGGYRGDPFELARQEAIKHQNIKEYFDKVQHLKCIKLLINGFNCVKS